MILKERAISFLKFLVYTHLLGILFFTLFRVLLLFSQWQQLQSFPSNESILLKAFFMGFRFDLVIACYIISLPLVLLSVFLFVRKVSSIVCNFITIYIPIIYIAAFFICASNIPYFSEFNKNIDGSVFNWVGKGTFSFKMVAQEPKYYSFFFVFLIISAIFIFLFRKIAKKHLFESRKQILTKYRFSLSIICGFCALIVIGLCILGIRGRTSKKSPIRVGTAYFSNYPFPNQLALNPLFAFMRSTLDMQNESNGELKLISYTEAQKIVKEALNVPDSSCFNSPITREVISSAPPLRANVVVVLMEGMSAHFMQRFGNSKKLTPFLDSLSYNALFFENFYSDGIHTMNGLYASLWGFPSLLRRHPLDQVDIPQFMGLPNILKNKGYSTIYFSTHDDQFDNVGGFFTSNGFEKIVCQKDYPSEKVVSALGVPDDYMFNFSFPFLRNLNDAKKPFLAVYLTASNHGPVVVPDYFKSNFTEAKDQIVEYSDWALKNFLSNASKQDWFENTIFVFLADHGNYLDGNVYDMPITYNHIPLFIYSKKFVKPRLCSNLSGQIDLFPIVMGLLNESYINNTLGINTLIEKRVFISFGADDKIGCISDSVFSIDRLASGQSLYKYREQSTNDFAKTDTALATKMRNYARAMLQVTQEILKEKKTFVKEK